MLPNQKGKMSSRSIVREMPKVEIEIESEEDIEDVKEIIDVLESKIDKHGTHDQSTHGRGRTGVATTPSAASGVKRRQVANQISTLNGEHESLKTQLKEGKTELKRLKSDPSLPKVGAGIRFRTHPVNIQAGWNAKLEFDIENNRKKVSQLESELKSLPEG